MKAYRIKYSFDYKGELKEQTSTMDGEDYNDACERLKHWHEKFYGTNTNFKIVGDENV